MRTTIKRAAKQFGWLVLIWSASVLALGIIAYTIRAMLKA